MRIRDLARGESAGLVERQVPNGFQPIAFALQGPAGMNGLLPADADGHTVAQCCAVASRFDLFLPTAAGGDQPLPPPSDPTARAMTSKEVRSAAVACSPMNTLARLVRGIVSVGLNALELVSDT